MHIDIVRAAARVALALMAFAVLVAAAPASGPVVTQGLSLVDAPSQGAGSKDVIESLTPFLLVGLAVAIGVLAVAAGVILFRTRASAAPPPSPEDWWTCLNCSAGNLEGTARCHACGTWRSQTARPTPSATR